MRSCRESAPSTSVVFSKACCRPGLSLVAVLLLVFWPAASATAQSGSATPPAQLSTPPQSQTQTQSQPVSQSETAAQTDSGDKPQSLADAARKANAQKDKPKAKRVFTEDDLSSVRGTISVVGDGTAGRGSEQNWNSNAAHQGNNGASSAGKDEAYWRGRARAIKDQIADVDRQISDKKDEIAKSGPNGFDPSTGLSQNVIVVHDRNAELKQLEDRKQSLERQLDDLADEGRKAGADSGWFR